MQDLYLVQLHRHQKSLQTVNQSVKICGILNKGNTSCINTTLQCLRTSVQFWSSCNFVSKTLSHFVSFFVKIMSLLKSHKSAIEPSQFFRLLKQMLVKSGKPHFNIFEQQDCRYFDL